jgi:hypothetical protein
MEKNSTYLFLYNLSKLKLLIAYCLLFIACCKLLTACYSPRYVYSPAAHNVPVLVKKGDSKLAFNYSFNPTASTVKGSVPTKGKVRGFDVQGAYAINKHWAMQVNYFNRTERNAGNFDAGARDSVVLNYKRNLIEIGGGYFQALNNNKLTILQIFAGAGFGKSNFTDDGRDRNNVYRSKFHNMNVIKLFIQPAFMVRNKANFSATFSSRNSLIFFKNINTDYDATELDRYKLDSLTISPRLFWEPAVVNNFGFKKLPGLQLEFQLGFSFLMSRRFVDYRSFNFSAGLIFDVPKLFAVKKQPLKN